MLVSVNGRKHRNGSVGPGHFMSEALLFRVRTHKPVTGSGHKSVMGPGHKSAMGSGHPVGAALRPNVVILKQDWKLESGHDETSRNPRMPTGLRTARLLSSCSNPSFLSF